MAFQQVNEKLRENYSFALPVSLYVLMKTGDSVSAFVVLTTTGMRRLAVSGIIPA
ncbi:MAG: hypothetical protein LBE75_08500 [Burkholderiales bacterium]|jgi:hypothetical protein|nr:hypothetical protein [Burkholderiales bacterium]